MAQKKAKTSSKSKGSHAHQATGKPVGALHTQKSAKPAAKRLTHAVRPKAELTKSASAVRRMTPPKYQHFRLQKRIKHPSPKLPSVLQLTRRSFHHLRQHWRLFGGILLVYILLSLLLVRGLGSSSNISDVKDVLQGAVHGRAANLTVGFALFGVLWGDVSAASSAVGGLYQITLLVVVSLALLWGLRQTYAGHSLRVRDTFYKGMYPLVPFLLVLLVIGLQFLPLLAGNFLYTAIVGNGLAVTLIEKTLWMTLAGLLSVLSLYMIASSVFALYIVTLPDMQPMQALRSARALVRYRRWTVLRKLIFLPILLLVLAAIIMLPLILWWTPAAEWVFFVLMMSALVVVHSYTYGLYRELL